MYKRAQIISLTVALATVLALSALASTASAASVSVRIEGKTKTLFGASEPRFEAGETALDALVSAAGRGELYYHLATSSFGSYIDQIGLYPAIGSGGWMFKVNGVLPPVGADQVTLKPHDRVLWYWSSFDPVTFAGPKTLVLRTSKLTRAERALVKRTHKKRYCYAAFAQDDKGVATPALGAVMTVGAKRVVQTKNGRACLGKHWGSVRAALDGAVRSNALK